jgi:hypothetical protein
MWENLARIVAVRRAVRRYEARRLGKRVTNVTVRYGRWFAKTAAGWTIVNDNKRASGEL